MQHRRTVWNRMAAGMVLALIVAALTAALTWTPLATPDVAQAQGAQPADTTALFAPFWEAWDLLHQNYVDPLDDTALARGAIQGLATAGQQWLPGLQAP